MKIVDKSIIINMQNDHVIKFITPFTVEEIVNKVVKKIKG